ncbi:MAG: CDP-2,3-bis-(O-geranylgeranyl)-sn-glycerol synthase [Promethearchaeota archaeon]
MSLNLSLIMFLRALWFILPAYTANGLPVIFGGGPPLDFGKTINGKRIFGDGKTIRGFFGGVLSGTLVGLTLFYVGPILNQSIPESQGLIDLSFNPIAGVLLSVGALTGDLIGSFIKRRLDLKRGAPAPILDQITFLIFALLFASLIIFIPLEYVIILIPLTLGLHLFTNFVSWLIGLKKVPY